jgi:phosphoglycolate phosphatase
MKYEGVIFDLDGTLAYTLEDIGDSVNRVLIHQGFPENDYATYRRLIGSGLLNLIYQSLPEGNRDESTVDKTYTMMVDDYNENCLIKTTLYDGIREILLHLKQKGVNMAVYSNKNHDLTIKIVNQLVLNGTFSPVLGSRNDLPRKPDPAGVIEIMTAWNADPAKTAFIGDSDTDMQTAKRAGLFAIGVTWGYRDRPELERGGADVILDTPEQILNHL